MKCRKLTGFLCLIVLLMLTGICAPHAEELQAVTDESDAGVTITATTELRNQPTFTLAIPQTIPLGELQRAAEEGSYSEKAFEVSISDIDSLGDRTVSVRLSTADGRFCLYNGSYGLPYRVMKGDTALQSGDLFASFTAESTAAVGGKIVVDRYDIAVEGAYTGVLIFTVSVEE